VQVDLAACGPAFDFFVLKLPNPPEL
jgi:hypothetical protein